MRLEWKLFSCDICLWSAKSQWMEPSLITYPGHSRQLKSRCHNCQAQSFTVYIYLLWRVGIRDYHWNYDVTKGYFCKRDISAGKNSFNPLWSSTLNGLSFGWNPQIREKSLERPHTFNQYVFIGSFTRTSQLTKSSPVQFISYKGAPNLVSTTVG